MIDIIASRVRQMLVNKGYERVDVGDPHTFLYSKNGVECEVYPNHDTNCVTLYVQNYGNGLCVNMQDLTKQELEDMFAKFVEENA